MTARIQTSIMLALFALAVGVVVAQTAPAPDEAERLESKKPVLLQLRAARERIAVLERHARSVETRLQFIEARNAGGLPAVLAAEQERMTERNRARLEQDNRDRWQRSSDAIDDWNAERRHRETIDAINHSGRR